MSTDAKLARFPEVDLQESFSWRRLSLHVRGPLTFVLFCVALISMLLFYSYWNSWTTNLVFEMGTLYKQRNTLKDQIASVRADIAQLESLAEVEKRAVALGLRPNTAQVSVLPISYQMSGATVTRPVTGVAALRDRFTSARYAGGDLPAALSALVAEFQEWVNDPHSKP